MPGRERNAEAMGGEKGGGRVKREDHTEQAGRRAGGQDNKLALSSSLKWNSSIIVPPRLMLHAMHAIPRFAISLYFTLVQFCYHWHHENWRQLNETGQRCQSR